MKPVVGILCCGFDGKNQFVTDTYVRAVRISGGIPLLIPILPQDFPINSYLDICDGFLLPGGGDFTPFLFNEDPLPGVGQTNLSVDLFQIHFAEEILKRHLPVIGICRGMQVLNAACGGSIYQDLSCQPGDPFLHMQTSQNRSDMWHQIFIAKDSHLHELTGDTLYTNSFHHQSVHLLGKMSMHVHTLLMAQLRQLKSKDSLLHLAFSGIRNPCFLLLHVCGNCFRFSSGRCFPEQTKSLLSGCRLCCLRSLQNICIICSQTFIILSNYKHTFFTRYEYTNNCQKEINLFT